MSCPSQLRLDEWLEARGDRALAAHVEGCARCRARVAALEAERADFARRARPAAFADAVLARRRRAPGWWAPLLALAAACALVLLVRARTVDEEAYKGGPPEVQLWIRHEGQVARYEPDRRYLPGDVVQVVVLSTRPTWVSVVDVEEGGEAQLLYAAERALPAGRSPLPRSFELDDWKGGESLVVLLDEHPVDEPLARARRGEGQRYLIRR